MNNNIEIIAIGRGAELSQFADSDGLVRFDFLCDDNFVAITKRIDDTNDPGKLRQDVVSSLTFPISKKNIAIIGDVGSPNAFNRIHSKPIAVSVRYGMYCLEATQLVFTTTGDVPYQAEIFGTANEWINAISKIKLSDIDCGIIPSYDWDFIRDRHENFWFWQDDELPVFPPYANYGKRRVPDCISFVEMRLWLSPLFLLREGFCLGGYEFVCPLLETEYGRRLWIYVLREGFDEQGQETDHAFSANTTADIPIVSSGSSGDIIFDNDLLIPSFDNGDHYEPTTGVFSGIAMRADFVAEVRINVTGFVPGFSIFSIQIMRRTANGDIFGLASSDVANVSANGEYLIEVTQENLQISETDEIFVSFNSVGLTGNIMSSFTKFYNEPKAVKLQQGDAVTISEMIRTDLTVLDLLRGMVDIFNLKPEFDQTLKQVRFYPSDGADLYADGEQEAYFFPNSDAKNWTKKIHKKSLQVQIGRNETLRNFSMQFKNDSADFKVNELENEFPLHASNEDFSDCFPEGTKKSTNPFFAPTINEFDLDVRFRRQAGVVPDSAPWLPHFWKAARNEDGTLPETMRKIVPRILLSYPYGTMSVPAYRQNGQRTSGDVMICDDPINSGLVLPRQEYSPVSQIMPEGFQYIPPGQLVTDYDGAVVYGTGDYNDTIQGLYEIVYRQSIKRLYYSALLEFLVKLELIDIVNFNPRCKFFIRYQSRTLGELLFYARVVEITDYALGRRILTPVLFEPDANYFELECPCDCEYTMEVSIEFGTELIPATMTIETIASEGCGNVEGYEHDFPTVSNITPLPGSGGNNTPTITILFRPTDNWELVVTAASSTDCGDVTAGVRITGDSTNFNVEQL